jgi:hypothetical protein
MKLDDAYQTQQSIGVQAILNPAGATFVTNA